MPRFEVKQSSDLCTKKFVQLLDNEKGQRATIYHQGTSLQELVFRYRGELVNVVYGHQDYADFLAGLPRSDVPRIDPSKLFDPSNIPTEAGAISQRNQDIGRFAEAQMLMEKNPAWAGAVYLDLANRTFGGKGVVLHPVTGDEMKYMKFPINHPDSGSFIHGNAMHHDANLVRESVTDDYAMVMFMTQIGIGLEDFPREVYDLTTFKLSPEGFQEIGTIINMGKEYAPVTVGRHSSYRIGKEGIEDHRIIAHVCRCLEVDERKNPTGRILELDRNFEDFFDLSKEHLDTTFMLNPGRGVILENSARGYGLNIEAKDSETSMVTLWTHELPEHVAGKYVRQFAAIELLVGGHSAMLSLPLTMGKENVPHELRQRVLAPGHSLSYERMLKPELYK